ncbi:thermonuclease family protein [Deefgea piscis]|uniref:thermonuclease family protein n=1 Tax=Deefgea piscis TaxID=2739061 RepID=UPI002103B362|nr:thermonuclease family protein [Deefgea piscis]
MMLRFFLFFLFISSAHAETLSGHIIGINDGDTATLLTTDRKPVKIRLWQIDAPERDQAFGEKSKQSLSDLIYRKDVTVQVDTQDQYGRSVGKVFVGGMDVNLEQIKRGMAWFYTQYGSDEKYRAAEKQAKAAKYGLWIDPAAEAPWQWRASGKTSRPAVVNSATNQAAPSKTATSNPPAIVSNYRCDGRQHCSQMSSCAEATYFIKNCPNVKMDGNNDGIPCEKQWCK